MKNAKDILCVRGVFYELVFPVSCLIFLIIGAVLCILKYFILGIFFISLFAVFEAIYLISRIWASSFAILDNKFIRIKTLYNKTQKTEKWEDLKSVYLNELAIKTDIHILVNKFFVLYFTLLGYPIEDSYNRLEQMPHTIILADTKTNRKVLKKYLPKQFQYILDDRMRSRTLYIKGNYFCEYFAIYIIFLVSVISIIFCLTAKIDNIILFALLVIYICFILTILMSYSGKPIRLVVNSERINLMTIGGLNSLINSQLWGNLSSVTIKKNRWKSEYIVMSFSDEDIEGKTLKELIDSPHVMVAKLNKRSRKILLQFLPEQFKERVLLPR